MGRVNTVGRTARNVNRRQTYTVNSRASDRRWWWLLVPLLAVMAAVMIWWMQPSVKLGEGGYDLAIAVYNACNRRSDQGIDQIEALLDQQVAQSQVTVEEEQAIRQIIAATRTADWTDAAQRSRALLEAQVVR